MAKKNYEEGQIMVMFKEGTEEPKIQEIIAKLNLKVIKPIGSGLIGPLFLIEVPDGEESKYTEVFQNIPEVDSAMLNGHMYLIQ